MSDSSFVGQPLLYLPYAVCSEIATSGSVPQGTVWGPRVRVVELMHRLGGSIKLLSLCVSFHRLDLFASHYGDP